MSRSSWASRSTDKRSVVGQVGSCGLCSLAMTWRSSTSAAAVAGSGASLGATSAWPAAGGTNGETLDMAHPLRNGMMKTAGPARRPG